MYKGNINDFMEKIISYAKEQYGEIFKYERSDDWELDKFKMTAPGERKQWIRTGGKHLVMWHYGKDKHGGFGIGHYIYDAEDLEEQVYKFVNERLNKAKK